MSSFIKTVDDAMKTLVFTKFQTDMGLTTQNTDLVFFPKSIAQRTIAEKRGANQAEFISLWRTGIDFDWARQRSPVARRGIMMEYSDGTHTSIVTAKAVPATISYDVWFWSRSLDKVMAAIETYLNWVHINPNLSISFNNLYPMQMDIKFKGVTDESTYLEDQYNKGALFVYKVSFDLEAWIVTLVDFKTILKIYMDVWYSDDITTAGVNTGVGTVTTNGTITLTGVGTDFLSRTVGDKIYVSGEGERIIVTITNNTSLTVDLAFSTSASGLVYTTTANSILLASYTVVTSDES